MANLIYNSYKVNCATGDVHFLTDTIKVALVTSAYTPDQDNHNFFDDVTNEITSSGYTAGGATLATKTITQDNTNNRSSQDALDVTWTALTATIRGAVVYKSTGTASTSPLLMYYDFVSDQVCTAQDFTITWNGNGLYLIA